MVVTGEDSTREDKGGIQRHYLVILRHLIYSREDTEAPEIW
jgi:hypothetical protein